MKKKQKKQKQNNTGTVPKSNETIVKSDQIDTPNNKVPTSST
jgi:hypothetical protein